MKASNYNFFFPYKEDNSKLIAYNSFSNALALMDRQQHSIFKNYCDNSIEIEDEEFFQNLKSNGFLIGDSFNEKDMLRLRLLSSRYSTKYLGLTIAPTADCNFRCPYCYEKDALCPLYMGEEVQDKIIELVKQQANNLSFLSITWYGGEPLLALNTIKKLSKEFLTICEEYNIKYSANIVTNGYLLTRKNIETLNELKITSMQVTLDGSKEIHNNMRPLANGLGTFDIILDNLTSNIDILPMTSIRVNVDKNNITSAKEVIELLREKELLDKLKPYLGRITPDNGTYDCSRCFDVCGFSNEEFSYYKEVFGEDDNFLIRYPSPVSNVCTADCMNSFIISADGKLYKCWVDIGNDDKVTGSLLDVVNSNTDLYLQYLLHDPTLDEKCINCKLLPICMGGCPYKRVRNEETCTTYKYMLKDYISHISEKIKLNKKECVSNK